MNATEQHERFEAEALPYLGEIFAFAHRLTGDRSSAEDLVQETFLRAFRFFHRYTPGTNIRAWLYKICRNTFVTLYHKASARPSEVEFDAIEGTYERALAESSWIARDNPEESLWRTLMTEEVERSLDRLPESYRSVVYLVLVKEFKYREAAEILDIPVGTVMSRLHRGRRALQVQLLEYARDARLQTQAAQAGGSAAP